MNSNLVFDVDQAGEVKAAFRRADWTNADIKKLCESELLVGLRNVLNGLADIVAKPILALFATFELPTRAKRLVVADEFVVGSHGIKYVDPSFTRVFGNLIEELGAGGTFAVHTFNRTASVADVATERGPKAVTMLGDVLAQMDKQSQGQEGPLLVNGCANLLKVKDAQGNEFAVNANWHADDGGWYVYSHDVAHRWYDGYRFLSRN